MASPKKWTKPGNANIKDTVMWWNTHAHFYIMLLLLWYNGDSSKTISNNLHLGRHSVLGHPTKHRGHTKVVTTTVKPNFHNHISTPHFKNSISKK